MRYNLSLMLVFSYLGQDSVERKTNTLSNESRPGCKDEFWSNWSSKSGPVRDYNDGRLIQSQQSGEEKIPE